MNQFGGDQNSCDITMVAKDGEQFQAHRNVLSQASPFFEKLLSSDMKESNEGVIRLPTITESQMADILQFIYNGSVPFTSQENAEKLIKTADFLLLSNLKTVAGKFLEQQMTIETCISMNHLAQQYSCEELVASTQKFINSCFYLPATDEWYLLPANECQRVDAKNMRVDGTVSCLGKVFVITDDVARSQCYHPDSNRWSSAPWKNMLPLSEGRPLVVKNRICFLVEKTGSTALWTYSLDSNSLTPLRNWVERTHFCAVAVDSFVYVMGGRKFYQPVLKECARFDTDQGEWEKIAPLNEARANAFGVAKNEKIFIAGGSTVSRWRIEILNTCEVYNILTDEWQFIANLTLRRNLGTMVLIDDTLYVLGGRTTTRYPCPGKSSDNVECYNHESNEWNDKATVPVSKITIRNREKLRYSFKGCFFQVFKGVLTNLESIDLSG